jgi:hypothetical protein
MVCTVAVKDICGWEWVFIREIRSDCSESNRVQLPYLGFYCQKASLFWELFWF